MQLFRQTEHQHTWKTRHMNTIKDGMTHEDEIRNVSNTSTLSSIICVVAGTGILAIANAVSKAGWIGLFFLCLSACMSQFTGSILIQCLYHHSSSSSSNNHNQRLKDYSDIGLAAFGRPGQIIGWLASQLFLILTPTIYITMASENIAEVLIDHGLAYLDKTTILWILIIIIGTPFIFVRNMKDVSLFSTFASICTVCLLLVVVAASLSPDQLQLAYTKIKHDTAIPRNIPIAFSTFTFSYCGHVIYPNLEGSMVSPHRWSTVLLISTIVVSIMYLLMGTVGYFIFGHSAQAPIYRSLIQGPLRYLAMLVITLHVLLAIPFYLYVFTIKLESGLNQVVHRQRPFVSSSSSQHADDITGIEEDERKLGRYIQYMVRVMELVVCGILSMFIPHFSPFMALVGTVLADTLSFVLPTAFWIKLNWRHQNQYTSGSSSLCHSTTMGLCVVVGSIGIVCAIIGSIDATRLLMKEYIHRD